MARVSLRFRPVGAALLLAAAALPVGARAAKPGLGTALPVGASAAPKRTAVALPAGGSTATKPSLAATPQALVRRWSPGDWWDVQLEHQMVYASSAEDWTPSFRLHFRVVSVNGTGAQVVVTTIPANRLQESLMLIYAPDGKLAAAQVVNRGGVEPLGPAGSPGIFGMLGPEAFELSKAPAAVNGGPAASAGPLGVSASSSASPQKSGPLKAAAGKGSAVQLLRIGMDAKGGACQEWERGGRFWQKFSTSVGLPQRATLVAASWR
jgi:hypothetical protein